MKCILIWLLFLALGVCHAEIPSLFTQKSFTSATLAEAVNRYVAIGEVSAVKELQQLGSEEIQSDTGFGPKGFSVTERIGWVCRILYEPRGKSPLRAPEFGELPLPEKSMPLEQWPIYPLASSGTTYFVLKQGYTPDGTPEKLTHYLAYCKNKGVFRKIPLIIPTQEMAEQDAANLRLSAPWLAIQWQTDDGNSFPMGEQLTWSFIKNQIKSITPASVAKTSPKTDSAALSLR